MAAKLGALQLSEISIYRRTLITGTSLSVTVRLNVGGDFEGYRDSQSCTGAGGGSEESLLLQ